MPLRTRNSELNTNTILTNGRELRAVASRLSCRPIIHDTPAQRRTTEIPVRRFTRKPKAAPLSSPSPHPETTPIQALHAGKLDGVVGREKEIAFLQETIGSCLTAGRNGSLYISGAPGTGKTATVTQEVQSFADMKKCNFIFLNCMQMVSPRAVYSCLLEKLCGSKFPGGCIERIVSRLENCLENASKNLPLVIILDEIDQLASRCQEVLYTIFGWPDDLKNAHIFLIGIANALDLTERLLPCLLARSCRPIHLSFPPYSKEQIVQIISSRLLMASAANGPNHAMDTMAIQFCARKEAAYAFVLGVGNTSKLQEFEHCCLRRISKADWRGQLSNAEVAAGSGDVRTALAICRRAIELARLELAREEKPNAATTRTADSSGSPERPAVSASVNEHLTPLQRRLLASPAVRNSIRRRRPPLVGGDGKENCDAADAERFVVPGVRHIGQAIREAQSGGDVNAVSVGFKRPMGVPESSAGLVVGDSGMPLHHKLVLAASLLLRRLRGLREASVGQVYEVYCHVCSTRGHLATLEMSDFMSVCELLDSHGVLRFTRSGAGGGGGGGRASLFSTPARSKRVALNLDDKGVEASLNDNLLFSSILEITSLP